MSIRTRSRVLRFMITVLSLLVGRAAGAADAEFLGTWTLGVVFGDSRGAAPRSQPGDTLVIRETPGEIIVERPGNMPVAYGKDEAEHLYDLGGSGPVEKVEQRRQLRTQLIRLGPALVTRTTPVREEVDAQSGAKRLVAAGVTTVEVYTLSADRRYLAVAKTASRRAAPEMPQDRQVRRGEGRSVTDVFVRSGL
jgi:hypothetical protein